MEAPRSLNTYRLRPHVAPPLRDAVSALCLVSPEVLVIGTRMGEVICGGARVLLNPRHAVTRLVAPQSNIALAVCGGAVYALAMGPAWLSVVPHAFSNKILDHCVDVALNQRGKADGGLCILTVQSAEDGVAHLFGDFSPKSGFAHVRDVALRGVVGRCTVAVWYENVLCIGGLRGVALVDDVAGKAALVPVTVDAARGPLLLALPEGRLLVSAAGGVGVIVDLQGLPDPRQPPISWPSSPVALALSGPYVIALVESTIEISHADDAMHVLQRISLPDAPCALASDSPLLGDRLFAAASSTAPAQPEETALSVGVGLLTGTVVFLEALPLKERLAELLRDDGADPRRALALLKESMAADALDDDVRAAEAGVHVDAAALALELGNVERALANLSLARVGPAQVLAMVAPDAVDAPAAVRVRPAGVPGLERAVASYLMSYRASHNGFGDSALELGLLKLLVRLGGGGDNNNNNDDDEEAAQLCDDGGGTMDVDAAVGVLDAAGKPGLAGRLLAARGRAAEACAVFTRLDDVDAVARLIGALQGEDAWGAAEWLLRRDADKGVAALKFATADPLRALQLASSVSTRPRAARARVAMQLGASALAVRELVPALEEAMELDRAADRRAFGQALIDAVAAEEDAGVVRDALGAMAKSRFGARLARERVAALGRLGAHAQALRVLVYELDDVAGAEAYCVAHASAVERVRQGDAGAHASNPFVVLLGVLLEQRKDGAAALDFLARFASKLDPIEALDSLPEGVPVAAAAAYLEAVLKASLARRRLARVAKNLARSENLQAKVSLVRAQRSDAVVVTADTACWRCGAKLKAGQAIEAAPDNARVVAHVQCPPVAAASSSSSSAAASARKPMSASRSYSSSGVDNGDDDEYKKL